MRFPTSAGLSSKRMSKEIQSPHSVACTNLSWKLSQTVARCDRPSRLDISPRRTVHYRYDAARQLVGVIGPDPDGAGPLLRRAVRNTYNPRGQVTLSEQGTVTGLTDPNWAAFVTLQRQAAEYDAYGRPTHTRAQAAGGATHALSQVGYDARGRVDCVATRMNPATFASPPGSACTLATPGAFGPDRVVRYGYDLAGQIIEMTSGYGSLVTGLHQPRRGRTQSRLTPSTFAGEDQHYRSQQQTFPSTA